ncbi:MAG: hypothetical protein ACXVBZ_13245 [Flavisolibacter sp.]
MHNFVQTNDYFSQGTQASKSFAFVDLSQRNGGIELWQNERNVEQIHHSSFDRGRARAPVSFVYLLKVLPGTSFISRFQTAI